jgi:hypothetical protein
VSQNLVPINLDTQQKELIGTALFEVALLRQGFEIAQPRRDRGIDLIVFVDKPGSPFRALPLQLKVATRQAFNLDKKYDSIPGLVLAYVWVLDGQEPEYYLMTFAEAEALLGEARDTDSWRLKGQYAISTLDNSRRQQMQPYRNRWQWLLQRLNDAMP